MIIGNQITGIGDFQQILFHGEKVEIANDTLLKVKRCYDFLQGFCEGKVIYGINTGFGPMAPYRINKRHQKELQYNLIRSHASGSGNPLPPVYIKSLMISRLNTLLLGYSGVHPSVILLLKDMINTDILPLVFEHGGVGASGDLVQLAHLSLGLIGEGECYYKGNITETRLALQSENLQAAEIYIREGLGIMNGTAAMCGIGMINLMYAHKLTELSILFSCIMNEIVRSFSDHFSEELNHTKLHQGQRNVAKRMRENLADSKLIRTRQEHMYSGIEESSEIIEDKVQEYYSLRCVPQILGPVTDTLEAAVKVLENEINSANDNPVIDPETKNVYHGGNFHGDYPALEMDKIRIAITKLSMLSERQINYLMNHKLNNILPPFANLGKLGLNFGMQGVQFTAVSTTAENQTLSNPMYIHSIPNNNDNQDIVSMGSNSAWLTKKVIDNTFEVLAIQAMCLVQAIDYLECNDKLSAASRKFYQEIRTIFPVFKDDEPKYKVIKKITEQLKNI
jgi:histidine ammonia-lyase